MHVAIYINKDLITSQWGIFVYSWHTLFTCVDHFLSGMVDTIFADVAQPDQARIVAINAHSFLKNGGHFVISIKVMKKILSCWCTPEIKAVGRILFVHCISKHFILVIISPCLLSYLSNREIVREFVYSWSKIIYTCMEYEYNIYIRRRVFCIRDSHFTFSHCY